MQNHNKTCKFHGFTIVELLIVFSILGLLTSIALPAYLKQTGKAKVTEAKATASAIFKNASSEYQDGGMKELNTLMGGDSAAETVNDADCSTFGAPESYINTNTFKTLFDYSCTTIVAIKTIKLIATGNKNDPSLDGQTLSISMNLSEGTQELNRAETCPIFGGTKAGC